MFGPELVQAFREFKRIWDPDWRMNPGRIVDPRPLDADLRSGPDFRPRRAETHFSFAEDAHSFADATQRCFGVGKCRALGGQIMCPSFQATREEMHSTRGRAHLLFEMMRGETIKAGWRSDAVREALDLCLQCKGCKHDCPVSVDMATYKAEFLSHYYAGRLRPRAAYSMGLIFRWSRLAMLAPGLVNGTLRAPLLGTAMKLLAGFAPEREAPAYAAETFQNWWRKREPVRATNPDLPAVLLWPDTFCNYFLPGTLKAAVTVLEDAGYRVTVPAVPLCCGRPLYDYGMLDLARAKLLDVLRALRPAIAARIPIVVLEPSCLSVFRDEMLNLLPENRDARQLAEQAKTLGEVLAATPHWSPPPLPRRALLHMHCHHRSVLDPAPERQVLQDMGLEIEQPPVGCCGLAGSFGYEREHYPVSMQIGEQVLLPHVRKMPADSIVIADGFSCRQQIRDGTGRWAMHPAEVIALAIESAGNLPRTIPEGRYLEAPPRQNGAAVLAAAGLALGIALVAWRSAYARR
jgi:Fe-S oxidoreductase